MVSCVCTVSVCAFAGLSVGITAEPGCCMDQRRPRLKFDYRRGREPFMVKKPGGFLPLIV